MNNYKLFLSNGKQVKIGDVIRKTFRSKKDGLLVKEESIAFTLTPLIAVQMFNDGELTVGYKTPSKNENFVKYKVSKNKQKHCKSQYYSSIAEKVCAKAYRDVKDKYNLSTNNLGDIITYNPSVFFSMMLREIAINLDLKYKDTINKCTDIYVISSLNGKISKVSRKNIKNFKNFAAFRTYEDALLAKNVLRHILKLMFCPVKHEQKDKNC